MNWKDSDNWEDFFFNNYYINDPSEETSEVNRRLYDDENAYHYDEYVEYETHPFSAKDYQ